MCVTDSFRQLRVCERKLELIVKSKEEVSRGKLQWSVGSICGRGSTKSVSKVAGRNTNSPIRENESILAFRRFQGLLDPGS